MSSDLQMKLQSTGIDPSTLELVESPLEEKLYSVMVPGPKAIEAWKSAREILASANFYPVLIGDQDNLESISEEWESWAGIETGKAAVCGDGIMPAGIKEHLATLQEHQKKVKQEAHTIAQAPDLFASISQLTDLNSNVDSALKTKIELMQQDGSLERTINERANEQKALFERLANPAMWQGMDALEQLQCPYGYPASTADFIKIGEELDIQLWLKKRAEAQSQYYACEIGNWPQESWTTNFSITQNMDQDDSDEVLMLILPTDIPWHVPAILRFGGWDECPVPQVHVAIFKLWNEKYGAEVVSLTRDSLEMRINHPINNKEEALKVAQAQFIYCADLVRQDDGKLASLAAKLLNANVWSFWWD